RSEHQDLAFPASARNLRFGSRRGIHGALGSILSCVVELMQNPADVHGGERICRPGKKIGTAWLTRTRTNHAVWLSAAGQSVSNRGRPGGTGHRLGSDPTPQSAPTPSKPVESTRLAAPQVPDPYPRSVSRRASVSAADARAERFAAELQGLVD